MIRVNANLFRIAYLTVSHEETRYYLNGVFVEPHHSGKGATLTSTDGHRLMSIYDENGICDAPAIVKISPEALKSCKPAKSDPANSTRVLHVDVVSSCGKATVCVVCDDYNGDLTKIQTVAISERCIVDGTFPNYREVVRGSVREQKGKPLQSGFNSAYVREFCDIGKELAAHTSTLVERRKQFASSGQIVITGATHGETALISFPNSPIAFGLLMPMRTPTGFKPELPGWFASPAKPKLQAVALSQPMP